MMHFPIPRFYYAVATMAQDVGVGLENAVSIVLVVVLRLKRASCECELDMFVTRSKRNQRSQLKLSIDSTLRSPRPQRRNILGIKTKPTLT